MTLLVLLVLLAQAPDNDLPDVLTVHMLTTDQVMPPVDPAVKAAIDAEARKYEPIAVAPQITTPPLLNGMRGKYKVIVGGKVYEVVGRKDEAGLVYYTYSENPHVPRPAAKALPPPTRKAPAKTSARRSGSCPVCGGGCPRPNCRLGIPCGCGAC